MLNQSSESSGHIKISHADGRIFSWSSEHNNSHSPVVVIMSTKTRSFNHQCFHYFSTEIIGYIDSAPRTGQQLTSKKKKERKLILKNSHQVSSSRWASKDTFLCFAESLWCVFFFCIFCFVSLFVFCFCFFFVFFLFWASLYFFFRSCVRSSARKKIVRQFALRRDASGYNSIVSAWRYYCQHADQCKGQTDAASRYRSL